MKTNVFIILGIILAPTGLNAYKTIPFIGKIKFPQAVRTIPALSGYYEGQRFAINNCDSSNKQNVCFQINESPSCNTLGIVFTSKVIPTGTNKHILALKIPSKVDYAFYQLSKISVINDMGTDCRYCWKIEKQDLNNNKDLPKNTIIILLNPEFIKSLHTKAWKTDDHFACLPTIMISQKKGIDKKIQKAAISLKLAAMDVNAFHSVGNIKTKKDDLSIATVQK